MCLAIPAIVMSIHDTHAEVDIMGVRKKVNVQLVDNVHVGDKVMVHAGFAISKIEEAYFRFLEDALREMAGDGS